MPLAPPRIKTTVVGSYPVPDWLVANPSEQGLIDATRVVLATQEAAGVDVVCDGELYRFDPNHPETNGMIEYFVRPMKGVRYELDFAEAAHSHSAGCPGRLASSICTMAVPSRWRTCSASTSAMAWARSGVLR